MYIAQICFCVDTTRELALRSICRQKVAAKRLEEVNSPEMQRIKKVENSIILTRNGNCLKCIVL